MRSLAFATLISGAMLVSACGSGQSGSFTNEDGEEGSYSFENGEDGFSLNISEGDSKASMNAGGNNSASLPYGFSVYPGAIVLANFSASKGNNEAATISMTSPDSARNVADFYKTQAENAGIYLDERMFRDDAAAMTGKSPEGVGFIFNAAPNDKGVTTISLMIGKDID